MSYSTTTTAFAAVLALEFFVHVLRQPPDRLTFKQRASRHIARVIAYFVLVVWLLCVLDESH